jgi:nucleoside-diphosphate-sugar epimerase
MAVPPAGMGRARVGYGDGSWVLGLDGAFSPLYGAMGGVAGVLAVRHPRPGRLPSIERTPGLFKRRRIPYGPAMATVLVTGGAGFIGSHLTEALVQRGDRVRVLDDLSTGHRTNLGGVAGRFEMVEGSFVDREICARAVEGVATVFHQGALPSVPKSLEFPQQTHAANVTGTLNLLVAARDAGVRRFVYAASSSAYGDTEVLPKTESMPAAPKSPYAVQKHAGELYCRTFWENYGLPTVSLRYFNIFGPRQDPASPYSAVIPKFVTACLRDEAPVVNGDGSHSRDFTFVDNVVHANLLAAEAPEAAFGRVFNVACGERIDLLQLASEIRAQLGRGRPPVHGPVRPGDVLHSQADLTEAGRILGYVPQVRFREGIARTVAAYRGSRS